MNRKVVESFSDILNRTRLAGWWLTWLSSRGTSKWFVVSLMSFSIISYRVVFLLRFCLTFSPKTTGSNSSIVGAE